MCCQRAPCLSQREGKGEILLNIYFFLNSQIAFTVFRFILKTCGTTTPLDCIEDLTRLVKEYAGFDTVEVWMNELIQRAGICLFQEIFYSRKNSQRPELQKHPHRNFEQKYFGAGAGKE